MREGVRELILRGEKLYREKLKALLEPAQKGLFVAIEPDSEQYFLGGTSSQAMNAARQAWPEKKFFLARVGYPAAHTIGGYGARNRQG